MNFKKIIAAVSVSALAASVLAASASAATAGLTFVTNAWTFRNNINQSQALWWDEFDESNTFETWNVQDVEITADGTYTVSFEKDVLDDCKDGPESYWNSLKLQTNISQAEYPDLAITIDSFKVDGTEVPAALEATLGSEGLSVDDYSDIDSITAVSDAYVVGFYNTWNAEQCFIDSAADFGGKVEVTFTVTGYGEAAADTDADADADADQTGDTDAATEDKQNADTGVEGVAAVAGVAIIAAGAIIVAKKRK